MTRFATISAIVLTGAFTSLLANLQPSSSPTVSRVEDSEFGSTTQDRIVSYYCFKSTLTTTLEMLEQGKVSLAEARNHVYESALHHHPDYLKHIAECERGATTHERVARNLIGHLRSHLDITPNIQGRVLALEVEFAELQNQADVCVPAS